MPEITAFRIPDDITAVAAALAQETIESGGTFVHGSPIRPMSDGAGDVPGIPQTLHELPYNITRTYELSISAAAEASIPVAGGVSGGYNRRVVVLERCGYKPVEVDDAIHQYGYAIRLAITVSKRTAEMKLTLPFLAASAEMGEIEAKWVLQIIGLAGRPIEAATLPPTELNVETFVLAKQSLANLIAAIWDAETTFMAQRIAVELKGGGPDRDYIRAVAYAYALSRIEKNRSLDRALDELEGETDDVRQLITDAYAALGIGDPSGNPPDELRRKARQLLGGVKVDPR